MAGNTVADLNEKLTALTDELAILTNSIKTSLSSQARGAGAVGSQDLSMKKDIRDFKQKADSYDRQFEEEESRLQAYGGKTRKQTLQEFVLLFFFVAYGILTVSFALYANRAGMDSQKILGIMLFMAFILAGIIVSYA
jgi:lipopolysaccharide export LptBFGC system permease protein LptF